MRAPPLHLMFVFVPVASFRLVSQKCPPGADTCLLERTTPPGMPACLMRVEKRDVGHQFEGETALPIHTLRLPTTPNAHTSIIVRSLRP